MKKTLNKEYDFIDWLCGKDVKFPFFQDIKDVEAPILEEELREHDCTASEEDGCEGCVKLYEAISEGRI